MHNILLTKIAKLGKMSEIELCPLCDFILYIFKDIARNLVLRYSNQIIFTFQVAYFRDPDRVRLSLLQFSHIQEVFQLHFFVASRGWLEGILELIDDRLLLTWTIISQYTSVYLGGLHLVVQRMDYCASKTVHDWQALCEENEEDWTDEDHR